MFASSSEIFNELLGDSNPLYDINNDGIDFPSREHLTNSDSIGNAGLNVIEEKAPIVKEIFNELEKPDI